MRFWALLFCAFSCSACQPGLNHQPRPSSRGYFKNPQDIQVPPPGIAEFISTAPAQAMPALTAPLLRRGQERYDIFCAVCHGYAGHGDGLAVERGFPAPQSFAHASFSRQAAYRAIREGQGKMLGFANRILPEDAWAIASYTLQLRKGKR